MAFITVYRLEHSARALEKGRLVSLTSKTNDDGTEHSLSVAAEGSRLAVHDDKQPTMGPVILPPCLWNSWSS